MLSHSSAEEGQGRPGYGGRRKDRRASSVFLGPRVFSHIFSLSNLFKKLVFFFFANRSVLHFLFNAGWDKREILKDDSTFISQIFFISHYFVTVLLCPFSLQLFY